MPQVGNKKFPYTEKGEKEAKEYGKKKSMPVTVMIAIGKPKAPRESKPTKVRETKPKDTGAEERYLADGYERVEGENGTWSMRTRCHSIHSSCFENPESCYTVATLDYRKGEGCCDLKTVGSRLLELSKPERADFFAVYEYAEDRIQEEELAREEETEY